MDDKSNCTSRKAWALPSEWKVIEVIKLRFSGYLRFPGSQKSLHNAHADSVTVAIQAHFSIFIHLNPN